MFIITYRVILVIHRAKNDSSQTGKKPGRAFRTVISRILGAVRVIIM